MTYPLFCLYNRIVPSSLPPLSKATMQALSSALLAALRADCASLRLIVSALTRAQVVALARLMRATGDRMELQEYIDADMESKIQELSYLATI